MRTIEELRELANDMNKSLEVLLYEMLNDAISENQKYKEVIDKAVEYIEKHLTDNGRFLMLNEWQVPDLLRILKEVE